MGRVGKKGICSFLVLNCVDVVPPMQMREIMKSSIQPHEHFLVQQSRIRIFRPFSGRL